MDDGGRLPRSALLPRKRQAHRRQLPLTHGRKNKRRKSILLRCSRHFLCVYEASPVGVEVEVDVDVDVEVGVGTEDEAGITASSCASSREKQRSPSIAQVTYRKCLGFRAVPTDIDIFLGKFQVHRTTQGKSSNHRGT